MIGSSGFVLGMVIALAATTGVFILAAIRALRWRARHAVDEHGDHGPVVAIGLGFISLGAILTTAEHSVGFEPPVHDAGTLLIAGAAIVLAVYLAVEGPFEPGRR